MTLSERNTFFKIGIIFCAVAILMVFTVSFFTAPNYHELSGSTFEEETRRSNYIFQVVTGRFLGNSYFAVHAALVFSALFSFIGMFLIHSFFERTAAPEILYISFFTFSLSFEVFRLFVPLHIFINFPSVYLRFSTQILLFARFFGIFSLFTAGLIAAGMDVQRTRNAVFLITIAALIIPFSVPIDVLSWNTGFNMVLGFSPMLRMIEWVVSAVTVISFFVAAITRGTKEYVSAAIGVMLALIGRNILLGTDNWIGAAQGVLFLSFGIWYICSKIHKIHLWL